MLKNRSHGRIERTIEITRDGETRVERISIAVSESTTEADVVRALAELTKFELPAET